MRRRLDTELVRRGLATSREAARDLVQDGRRARGWLARRQAGATGVGVRARGRDLDLAARRFVSRGGDKLDAALDRFAVDPSGRRCLDAGASTGGFTDCLLRRGASGVVAVDVGHGQLDASLRRDPRVEVLERTNIRTLTLASVGGSPFDLVVADLSFISLVTVAPVLAGELAAPGADVVVLVKPQFEAGRAEVSRGKGVIRRLRGAPSRSRTGGLRLRVAGSHHHGGHGIAPPRSGRQRRVPPPRPGARRPRTVPAPIRRRPGGRPRCRRAERPRRRPTPRPDPTAVGRGPVAVMATIAFVVHPERPEAAAIARQATAWLEAVGTVSCRCGTPASRGRPASEQGAGSPGATRRIPSSTTRSISP